MLAQALMQFPSSIEALLAMARNQVRLGNYEAAEESLVQVEGLDAFDWRVIWYRGLALMAQQAPAEAVNAFETCYSEVPGELAAKLAIAIASELSGDTARAIHYYDAVSRTDPNYATAVFGLARCLAAAGKRDEAVAALARIAPTSSLYGEAQKAMARTLIREKPSLPGSSELEKASATVEALMLQGVERFSLVRDIFATALGLLNAGQVRPAPRSSSWGMPRRDEHPAWARERVPQSGPADSTSARRSRSSTWPTRCARRRSYRELDALSRLSR